MISKGMSGRAVLAAVAIALAAVIAGCGGDDGDSTVTVTTGESETTATTTTGTTGPTGADGTEADTQDDEPEDPGSLYDLVNSRSDRVTYSNLGRAKVATETIGQQQYDEAVTVRVNDFVGDAQLMEIQLVPGDERFVADVGLAANVGSGEKISLEAREDNANGEVLDGGQQVTFQPGQDPKQLDVDVSDSNKLVLVLKNQGNNGALLVFGDGEIVSSGSGG